MWEWLKAMTGNSEVKLQGHAMSVNPSARSARNAERVKRLKLAIASGDKRPELKAELTRREKEGR
jgi:hypothetical protein